MLAIIMSKLTIYFMHIGPHFGQIRRIIRKWLWQHYPWYMHDTHSIGHAFFPEKPYIVHRILQDDFYLAHQEYLEEVFLYWLETDSDTRPKVWATVFDILMELNVPPDIIEAITKEVTCVLH